MGFPATRIVIVDDHPIVRDGLAIRVSSQEDMTICGEAADVEDALSVVAQTQPDVVVVDILLESGSGLELIKQLRAQYPQVRILVWSMYDEGLYAERALRAGALGYLNKRTATNHILEAIRVVRDGKMFVSPDISQQLMQRMVTDRSDDSSSPISRLSDRELQVFRLIGSGLTTSEIAEQLGVSIKTIETHRQRIKTKLRLRHSVELGRYAVQWVLENG